MTLQTPPHHLELLHATLHLERCRVILDPWAGDKAVHKGLRAGDSIVCLNDKLGRGGVHLTFEPLEATLYHHVIKTFGQLNAIVTVPPIALCDLALVNALEFASEVVCMLVPELWVLCSHDSRTSLFNQLERESRLLCVVDADPDNLLCWVVVFASASDRKRLLRTEHKLSDESRLVLRRCE